MSAKRIEFNNEARVALKKGIDELSNAVKSTLGPKGRNVVIERQYGPPLVTKDGVTVAQEIELSDPIENLGAQMVKEVASKTSDLAGDGTTTATVLAQAIVTAGLKFVAAGANPMDLKRGIDKAVVAVVAELKNLKTDVGNSKSMIAQVGTISANSDTAIGGMIAEAMEKVGRDGVITVEEAKGTETSLEVVEGMQFDNGYLSPYFVTDAGRMEAVLDKPFILLYDKSIYAVKDILPLLEKTVAAQGQILIISDDVQGEALSTIVVNKLKGLIPVCAVKAPAYGDRRKEMLDDIAIMTGATVVSDDRGMKLTDPNAHLWLGRAETVKVGKNYTTIVEGRGDKNKILERVSQIRKQIEECTSDYDKEKLQERLAKMTDGVAVIRIGALTEIEMKEKKARVDDALHATRAAVEEGIVPGGGVAYLRCLESLDSVGYANEDQKIGIDIIRKAITAPIITIATNAGLNGEVIMNEVLRFVDDKNMGFDAQEEEYVNMIDAGIIDPTKVSRVALENAASVAGLILTTDVAIVKKPVKEENHQIPQQGDMY